MYQSRSACCEGRHSAELCCLLGLCRAPRRSPSGRRGEPARRQRPRHTPLPVPRGQRRQPGARRSPGAQLPRLLPAGRPPTAAVPPLSRRRCPPPRPHVALQKASWSAGPQPRWAVACGGNPTKPALVLHRGRGLGHRPASAVLCRLLTSAPGQPWCGPQVSPVVSPLVILVRRCGQRRLVRAPASYRPVGTARGRDQCLQHGASMTHTLLPFLAERWLTATPPAADTCPGLSDPCPARMMPGGCALSPDRKVLGTEIPTVSGGNCCNHCHLPPSWSETAWLHLAEGMMIDHQGSHRGLRHLQPLSTFYHGAQRAPICCPSKRRS